MAVEIVPSGAALGAELRGLDLSRPLDDAARKRVEAAWAEHLVLLFRGQALEDRHLLALAEALGGVQVTGARAHHEKAASGGAAGARPPGVSVLSNLDEAGRPAAWNAGAGSGGRELVWHSDNSYVERPPKGTILYALEVPIDGGGDTSFANQYAACESLPEATRARLAGLSIRQDDTRNSAGDPRPGAPPARSRADIAGPVHPLLRRHPATGRVALHLGRRYAAPSSHVVELDDAEGEALLDELWEAATRPELVWTHVWRPGDLLIWDNRCALHRRDAVDPTQRRVMLRTLIRGEAPIAA